MRKFYICNLIGYMKLICHLFFKPKGICSLVSEVLVIYLDILFLSFLWLFGNLLMERDICYFLAQAPLWEGEINGKQLLLWKIIFYLDIWLCLWFSVHLSSTIIRCVEKEKYSWCFTCFEQCTRELHYI